MDIRGLEVPLQRRAASLASTVGCKGKGAEWAPKVPWVEGPIDRSRSQMGRAGDRRERSEGEADRPSEGNGAERVWEDK